MTRKTFIRIAWVFAGALAALVGAKLFVGDVYHVDTGSMEPTIHGLEAGGEWVFVRYDRSSPARGEIVVVLPPGESEPIVKRVAGLPFESVQVVHGDVWIDKKPVRVEPPVLVTMFDERRHDVAAHFRLGSAWSREHGEWLARADGFEMGAAETWLTYQPPFTDDYLASDGSIVRGEQDVNDAVIELDVRAQASAGTFVVQLTEQGDVFELAIAPSARASDRAELALVRTTGEGDRRELARAQIPFANATWHHVRFANVDDALRVDVDGVESVLASTYDRNTLHPGDLQHSGRSLGARLRLGAYGGTFGARALHLERDLCYTSRGRFGIDAPVSLGADEYFLLGDNSARSRDSREWGPVSARWIVGRAVRVVWPLARARRIGASENASD